MDTFRPIVTRQVAEHLNATGHSDAARAMFRVRQVSAYPESDGRFHVRLACSRHDAYLLRALTESHGGRSRTLDDAYQRVYHWVSAPFAFHFLIAKLGLADAG